MKPPLTDSQRKAKALTWLSIVRQATIDRETAAAYLTGLTDVDADVLEQACQDLGYAVKGEYEPTWPALATIRERCRVILARRQEAEDAKRLRLAPPKDPITQEQWNDIKARLQEIMRSKAMS